MAVDFGFLTVLAPGSPGLELWDGNAWAPVEPREGALIINSGDLLSMVSKLLGVAKRASRSPRGAGHRWLLPLVAPPRHQPLAERSLQHCHVHGRQQRLGRLRLVRSHSVGTDDRGATPALEVRCDIPGHRVHCSCIIVTNSSCKAKCMRSQRRVRVGGEARAQSRTASDQRRASYGRPRAWRKQWHCPTA